MYKIDKISNSILTTKGPIGENIFIWGKEIRIWMVKDSMRILKGLIIFIEDLFVRKISFGINLGVN
jgi:capsule polysaccharide export protein KpsC/LpsZ